MIEFEGSNFTFETFSYIIKEPIFQSFNMGRIHFIHSPIGIDYIEGSLAETDTEFVKNCAGMELEPIITRMVIMGIYKIRFKNGEEIVSEGFENARQGLAIPPVDYHGMIDWHHGED